MKPISLALLLTTILISPCHAADQPNLSAASIMCPNGEPFLLFGQHLDDPTLKLHVSDLAPSDDWKPADSLRRLLAGTITPPPQPPASATPLATYAADAGTAAVKAFRDEWKSPAKMLWAQTAAGFSNPLPLNTPDVWTLSPSRPTPGSRVRLFGINFSPRTDFFVCIIDRTGRITSCPWGQSYSGEKGISPSFERTFALPADIAPGQYQLFVNAGGGDLGWSRPFDFQIIPPTPAAKVYRCDNAPADGQTDAAPAIQAAIDLAASSGGGIVTLAPGNFLITQTLHLKPGVTLRGPGRAAATLRSPSDRQIPVTFHHYRSIVELASRSALESLTIDATPGEDHHAVLIRGTSDAALRHCEIINLRPTFHPNGKWVPSDNLVSATQHTYRLVVEDNILRGQIPFSHWGGEMTELYFAHNLCEGLPTQGANLSLRGLRRSIIEHNRITRSGRGLVVAGEAVHNYIAFNIIENIRGTSNGCEMFLYELGGTPWQGTPADITPNSFTTPGKTWDDNTLRSTADSFIFTCYALVTSGRGIGQCIPIASAQQQTITLARPWTVPPDSASTIQLVHGCFENIHLENQFKEGVAFSGVFGAAARNVWAGDEFERVSDGMVLWSLGRDHPISLNLLRDLRLQERAGILLIAGLETAKPLQQVAMLGNEIRTSQIYSRQRYPGNEYGLGNRVWRYGFNDTPPGNARHVTFGSEAAIHLSAFFDWPGNHTDEDPKLDQSIPPIRWTLIYDSLVARSPLAVRIGRGIEHTTLLNLVSELNTRPLSDSGRKTITLQLKQTSPTNP